MAGYSGKPLHAKLGLKPGQRVTLVADCDFDAYQNLLGPDAPEISLTDTLTPGVEVVHLFTASRAHLQAFLPEALTQLARDGMIWVSWPKKASKLASDVTEDEIREIALPLGLVDVKVCAVDATWSGLKLMLRKELR
ncbi:DUF3052 family protein [Roseovarius sp. CAU 1744]|uniref:DUF3052 family protein n=1 Tax=Roseovarius sp. CAU 1744 TaxID=3140368 RepID=UPI00325AAACD